MVEETATIGDTEVVIRETDDGFEVEEAEPSPQDIFEEWAENCPSVVDHDFRSETNIRMGLDFSGDFGTRNGRVSMEGSGPVYDEAPIEIKNMEADNTFGGQVYVRARFDGE